MLVLAIDTAGPACAAALVRDGETLASASEVIGRGHAERLMPMVESLLSRAALSFDAIDRIAVTTGPGSFTGVRVGIAAARGLALALNVAAVGVGSLEALAAPAACERKAGTLIAVLDARRGEVYALARDLASGETIVEAAALSAAALATLLEGAREPFVLVGAGAPIVTEALAGRAVEIAATPVAPDIAEVAALALAGGATPVPFYARAADAKPQASQVARQ